MSMDIMDLPKDGKSNSYPLVNINKKPWKITIIHGKTHYFYGHVPVRYVTNCRSSHNGSKDPPAETPAALAVSKPQRPERNT